MAGIIYEVQTIRPKRVFSLFLVTLACKISEGVRKKTQRLRKKQTAVCLFQAAPTLIETGSVLIIACLACFSFRQLTTGQAHTKFNIQYNFHRVMHILVYDLRKDNKAVVVRASWGWLARPWATDVFLCLLASIDHRRLIP